MFKKLRKNEKGFTLAELLIVVAIIGVLVAISIPIFTSQLEKSRDAVSVSNMRAAYAEAQTLALTATQDGEKAGNATAKVTDGKVTSVVAVVAIKSQKSDDNWSNLAAELPWTTDAAITATVADPGKAGNYNMTFTYTDGALTKVELATAANS